MYEPLYDGDNNIVLGRGLQEAGQGEGDNCFILPTTRMGGMDLYLILYLLILLGSIATCCMYHCPTIFSPIGCYVIFINAFFLFIMWVLPKENDACYTENPPVENVQGQISFITFITTVVSTYIAFCCNLRYFQGKRIIAPSRDERVSHYISRGW